MKPTKIAVVGTGYVGLANALLLAQHHDVVGLDILPERIAMLQRKESPLADKDITAYLKNDSLSFKATFSKEEAYINADYVMIATPTNYDPDTKTFDTKSIEGVIQDVLAINPSALMVIRATVPIGYVLKTRQQFCCDNLIFCPEFLREGQALYDNLYPSRIVVGEHSHRAQRFAELLQRGALKKDVPIILTNPTEAEAIKLFANTYLAMRVAFFNELDTYAAVHKLNSQEIIDGISLDPRIGDYYNNPSFGYGGYCLPKDTKQLLANYEEIPQSLIKAVVVSNGIRQDFIANEIVKRNPKKVGIFRLIMKTDADNCRDSSIQGIIERLSAEGISVCLYEPHLQEETFLGCPVIKDLKQFKQESTLIVSNRRTQELGDVVSKLYTRDLFGEN